MAVSGPGISLTLVPRTCGASDLMGLQLTGEEGFILSRIDGVTRVGGLCELSGLGVEKTLLALESLAAKNIIVLYDPESPHEAAGAAPGCEVPEEEMSAPGAAVKEQAALSLADLRALLRKPLTKGEELPGIVGAIFVNLEHLSYYDLLGIGSQAEGGQIKKAYIIRTKSFHPDRFYRNADKEFRDRVQEVFKQLNKGYRIISDPAAKLAYDQTLGEEELAGYDEEEVIEAGPVGRSRSVKGESPWKRVRVARHSPVEGKVKKHRPIEEKKPSGPKLKIGFKDGARPSPLLQKIHEMKKKEAEQNPNLEQAERLYKGAMVELGRQNYDAAEINLKLAAQYAPHNAKYKDALEQIRKSEQQDRAQAAYRAGMEAHRDKDFKGAVRQLREAMKMGIDTAKLYHLLAESVIEMEGNFDLARTLMLKAMDKEPNVADYHGTLARAYQGLGQKAAAVMQLEKVLRLDPKNKQAVKDLKALKRS